MSTRDAPSAELRELLARLRSLPQDPEASLADLRARSAAAFGGPSPAGAEVEPVDAGGVPAEWVRTSVARPDDHVTVLVRGGAFCIGGVEGRRRLAAEIGERARTAVLVVDYPLAPEHPFPAALDAVGQALRWLLVERGVDPSRLAVVGDSAGANLMLAAMVALRDEGAPLPAVGVALSPWVDLDLPRRPASGGDRDPVVSVAQLERAAAWYLQGADARDPRASPVHADLAGLPPLLIHVGRDELLLDDAQRLADRAGAAGVDVTLDVWDDVPHVWHLFGALPEARDAVARIGDFLQSHGRVAVPSTGGPQS